MVSLGYDILCITSSIPIKINGQKKFTKPIASASNGVMPENRYCICVGVSGSGCEKVSNVCFLLALMCGMNYFFTIGHVLSLLLEVYVSYGLATQSLSFPISNQLSGQYGCTMENYMHLKSIRPEESESEVVRLGHMHNIRVGVPKSGCCKVHNVSVHQLHFQLSCSEVLG